MQMEDELASIAAVIGASAAGAKAMTATSGPGFSLMQENLSYGMLSEIPCVLIDVMRQGPCQGVATVPAQGDFMQARWGTHGDHPVIVLAPNSVAEAYTQVVRAFNLAEKYRTPVIVLSDATLAHMSEKVRIPAPGELEIINRPGRPARRRNTSPTGSRKRRAAHGLLRGRLPLVRQRHNPRRHRLSRHQQSRI
jgi:2-oxoglutarate ferredoxin oxidoreductase subunit alpha